MKKRIFSAAVILSMLISLLPMLPVSAAETGGATSYSESEEDIAYLFAYFTGNEPEQERMHYAVSTDGYNFRALNGDEPVFTSTVGTGCLRDPFIFEGEDGYFYALATDMQSSLGWASNRNIITMRSADLINWEDVTLIEVTKLFPSMAAADRVWAPQAIYDPDRDEYMIYLAIRTNDGTENGPKTVMYRCWTEDFKTITEPELFLAPASGNSAIDGDIIWSEEDGLYYMYYKDETTQRIMTATAESLGGTFTETGVQLPSNDSAGNEVGVEGSAVYKLIGEDRYNVIYDAYGDGFFVMSETTDHKTFTQLDQSEYSFDFTPRHGYVIPINASELSALIDAYGAEQTIRLNPGESSPFNNGEFEGWGTSMGWWANRIGYDETLAQSAAELFYSEEGLGMDIIRYNVGGGDDPTHNHITRSDSKLPCLMNPDGTYNWDADYNQVNVLKKVKAENPDVHIEGYTNSPPWFMTESGCSSGSAEANGENLAVENYQQFVEFLADVTEHFEEEGLKFDSYSPMNEPNPATNYWGAYSPKQEGNHVAVGDHQSQLLLALKNEYNERGIDTLVVGPDETNIDQSITSFNALSDEAKEALDRLDTHTYGGSKRAELKATAEAAGKNLWMSEVDGSFTAGSEPYMQAGLGLAERIILDMNGMQPSAWVFWDIIDSHKDANFYYTDAETGEPVYSEANTNISQTGGIWGVAMADHDTKEIVLTKKYYAYGQFTKFIKPHMTIIASSDDSLAAYDKNTGEIVIVAINTDSDAKTTVFDMSSFTQTGSQARVIRTSGDLNGENWAELEPIPVADKKFVAELIPNSITTYVIENKPAAINEFESNGETTTYSYTLSDSMKTKDAYFAVYSADGELISISRNKSKGELPINGEGANAVLFVWDGMTPEMDKVDTVSEEDIDYISINGATNTVVGLDYNYEAVIGPVESDAEITWSVSDENVATITQDGVFTAKTGGRVTITATAEELGISAKITVDILDTQNYVTIRSKYSGLIIDTMLRGTTPGTGIMQWANESYDTSQWKLEVTEDGYFNIINRNNNLLLANVDGSPVITDAVGGTSADAKWEFINHSGYYEIRNVGLQKSLNVSGRSTSNGGSVILYEFEGADNELWALDEFIGEPIVVEPPEEVDYEAMYEGTGYTFVSNVDAATCEFNMSNDGFVVADFAGWGMDPDGKPAMYVQNAIRSGNSASRQGSAILTLDDAVTAGTDEYIDVHFDLYTPNSNGTSEFVLSSLDGTEIVKLQVTDWGAIYALEIGGVSVETAGDANTYFKNGTESDESTFTLANGAHVNVLIQPSTGAVTVTIENNTNDSPAMVYTGTADADDVKVYSFSGAYTGYSRHMLMGNLITNIIK